LANNFSENVGVSESKSYIEVLNYFTLCINY